MVAVLSGGQLRGALEQVVVDFLAVGVGYVRREAPEDIVSEHVAAALGPHVDAQTPGHVFHRRVRRARGRPLLHEHVVFAVAVVAFAPLEAARQEDVVRDHVVGRAVVEIDVPALVAAPAIVRQRDRVHDVEER